jgi:hypothetical protein
MYIYRIFTKSIGAVKHESYFEFENVKLLLYYCNIFIFYGIDNNKN